MDKMILIAGFFVFSLSIQAQEQRVDFNKAKINVFFKGFELSESIDHTINLSPNYIKQSTQVFSIYEPITQQNMMYNTQMEITNGSLSLDNLTRNIKRDSFNPHGATDFGNALGIGVANTILELLYK